MYEFMLEDEQRELLSDEYDTTRADYDAEIENEFQNLYKDFE